jgi:sarcosine oxidase, subunit beta
MRTKADVVIIGGGIHGCSAAYHLAKKGKKNAVLVEMDLPGSGSSGRSAAMLMHQTGNEQTTLLALISIAEYHSYLKTAVFKELEFKFNKTGSILFATEQDAGEELRRRIDMQNRVGVKTETMDSSDVNRKAPIIKSEGIQVASYCDTDGYIDPYTVVTAYVREARRYGIEIPPRVQALNIKLKDKKVVGVETNSGFIETEIVINAAGAFAGKVAKWVGIQLPIANKQRNILHFAPRPTPDPFPIVEDISTEWYFRPDKDDIMVGVGPQTDVDYIPATLQPGFDPRCLLQLAEYVSVRAPKLYETNITGGQWAGVRSTTPDELPIIGPVDEVEGFLNCCGWGGFGITLAPIGGSLIAEYVVDGKTTTYDINPFLFSRFNNKLVNKG